MANSYGFDPVAWSIDGGRHRGELNRVLAYAATSGAEGIVSFGDCKVHELSTPGNQVEMDAGALLIRNRAANVRNQTYVANGRTVTKLDVTPTPVGTARSDLVVVRVRDPQYAGWFQPTPAEAPDYQYVQPFIIENVPAGTTTARELNLGYAAVALARLDIPGGTATITNAMIKDLRRVARPNRERNVSLWVPPGATVDLPSTNGTRVHFPLLDQTVYVPEWASSAKMVVTLGNILARGYFTGHVRAELGFGPGMGVQHVATGYSGYHHDPQGDEWNRQTVVIGGELVIPENFRGREQRVRTGSYGNNGSTGKMVQDAWMTTVVDIEFLEAAA